MVFNFCFEEIRICPDFVLSAGPLKVLLASSGDTVLAMETSRNLIPRRAENPQQKRLDVFNVLLPPYLIEGERVPLACMSISSCMTSQPTPHTRSREADVVHPPLAVEHVNAAAAILASESLAVLFPAAPFVPKSDEGVPRRFFRMG